MRARAVLATATSLALLTPAALAVRALVGGGADPAPAPATTEQAARTAYGNLPLSFQRNDGQSDPSVKFLSQGSHSTLFLTADEAVLSLTKPPAVAEQAEGAPDRSATAPAALSAVLRTRFLGANPNATLTGSQQLPGMVNHFKGADPAGWHTNIPTFAKVSYAGLYPGIDAVYYGTQGEVEYDFTVAPGADPGAIRLGIEGAQTLSIDTNGDLVAQTAAGEVRQRAPVIYQDLGGTRRAVDGRFVLGAGDEVRFEVGRYDATKALVIDPTIAYSTWVGGGGADVGFGIAVANDGTAFIAGETASTNFPTTGGVSCGGAVTSSYQCNKGLGDAFVTKLNASGSALVYSTYIGGDRDDFAHEVAINADGEAFITGGTVSYEDPATAATEAAFPTTGNAYDATCGTDGNCNAPQHAGGFSCSTTCPTYGLWDAFVTKLSAAGDSLDYSSYLGGSDQENNAQGIAFPGYSGIAASGDTAYVGGYTGSTDFPTTTGAEQTTCGTSGISGCDNNNGDGFVTVIDTSQSGSSSLVYSQYLGGSGHEEVRSVATDGDSVWVTGTTYAEGGTNNFPTTNNAYQTSYQGGLSDGFVVKIKHTDNNPKVKYSTYLGGGGTDSAWGIAVDTVDKEATVVGWTNSGDDPATGGADGPTPYFPTTGGAYDTSFNGRATGTGFANLFYDGDAFVTRLNSNGSGLSWSTFIGGTDMDVATSVAVDSSDRVYITGFTTCQNNNGGVPLPPGGTPPAACSGSFPMASAVDATMDGTFINYENHNAPTDLFIAQLSADGTSLLFSTYMGGRDFERGFAVAVRYRDASGDTIDPEVFVTGRMASDNYATTTGSFQVTKPSGNGNRDAAVTKIDGL